MITVNLQKIRALASEQNKTLVSVAEAAGITSMGLSRIIKENSTKVETLARIADYLQVPITVFFDGGIVEESESTPVASDHDRALEILNEQLKVKDQQIDTLIKLLGRQA